MTGREYFVKYEKIINVLVRLNSFLPYGMNNHMMLLIRNIPGYTGILLRHVVLRNLAKNCGSNVILHQGVIIKGFKGISIGSNVSIHSFCYIDGTGGLCLKSNISIAHSTSILTTSHTWGDTSLPIKYNNIVSDNVVVHDDVWIGCGVRILAGVKVGKRSIIAAGAVVNKDVDSNKIVAGVPAVIIKTI